MGLAAQFSMRILVRMGELQNAAKMIDISRAHIDGTIFIGEAGLEFAERLTSLGGKVTVPTTLNVSGLDEHHWQEWQVDPTWAGKAHRQMLAYQSMGCEPIWTCAPYQATAPPRLGEQIAWGESNAIVFANSVCGARTERYPDYLDACAAIAGRVPAVGLHLDAHRLGDLLIKLEAIPDELQRDESLYPVLGYLLGRIAVDRIPVISGLSHRPSVDQLKALGAAAASSGNLALFHLEGITPEAPTLEEAFQRPRAQIESHIESKTITMDSLRRARAELTTADDETIDMVVLGSPHFSIDEFAQLTTLLKQRRCDPGVRFLVTSSRIMRDLAAARGDLDALQAFGGEITVDTCILATPMLPSSIRRLMTNSGKYAYYSPGLLDKEVVFGSLEDCVESAVQGRVVRNDRLW